MPLLIGVTVVKFVIVFVNKFTVRPKMFYTNVVIYLIFCFAIILIDYRR